MTNMQAFIIALGIAVAGIGYAMAQQPPAFIPGCVYLSSPPGLNNGQTSPLLCDSTGRLRVTTS